MLNLELRKALKILFSIVVMVWLAGVIVAALYYNVQRKKECIANEGWLKGVIWCSSELRVSPADDMVRGFFWPLTFIVGENISAAPPKPVRLTQQEFDGSTTGMVYLCWAIATKRQHHEDASVIQSLLTSMSAGNPDIRRDNSDYGILAMRAFDRLEGSGRTDMFYRTECEQQVSNIKASFAPSKQK